MKDIVDDNTVDLIITAPPRTSKNDPKSHYDFSVSWLTEAHRVMKSTGSMYVLCHQDVLRNILNAMHEVSINVVNIIVVRYRIGRISHNKYVFTHGYCVYGCKNRDKRIFFPYSRYQNGEVDDDGMKMHYRDREDIWFSGASIKSSNPELSINLVIKMIGYSSKSGALILDPFAGDGIVPLVASSNDREYIAFEEDKEKYKMIYDDLLPRPILYAVK